MMSWIGLLDGERELTIEQAQTYLTRVEQRLLQKRDGSQMNVHSDKEQHNTEHKKAPGR